MSASRWARSSSPRPSRWICFCASTRRRGRARTRAWTGSRQVRRRSRRRVPRRARLPPQDRAGDRHRPPQDLSHRDDRRLRGWLRTPRRSCRQMGSRRRALVRRQAAGGPGRQAVQPAARPAARSGRKQIRPAARSSRQQDPAGRRIRRQHDLAGSTIRPAARSGRQHDPAGSTHCRKLLLPAGQKLS